MFEWVALAVFSAIGYHDRKTNEIPHIYLSFLWVLLVVDSAFNAKLDTLSLVAVLFSFYYFGSSLAWLLKKEPLFGWADSLMIPVYFGWVFFVYPAFLWVSAAFILAPMFISGMTKKPTPMGPFAALGFLLALLTRI